MGKCKFCNQSAGLFKNRHKECEEKYNNGKKEIIRLIETKIVKATDYPNLRTDIENISKNSFIESIEVNELITLGFDNAVEKFLDDSVLSKDEEKRLNEFVETIFPNETQENCETILDKNGSLEKVIKATIIRDITEGIVPETKINAGQLPFVFQEGEKLIWVFHSVKYFEQIVKTHFREGSEGASIKVAKGIYYRTHAFKGYPVHEQGMKYLDLGLFAITDKQIYFSSSNKTLTIPFGKIGSIQPYEDGIGIHDDESTAKPNVFKGLDGWFTYNIAINLIQK